MTLSEIETTLEELKRRHPNLDTTLLTTLLSSSGWDEKTIKEALVLFSQKETKEPVIPPPPITQQPISVSEEVVVSIPAGPLVNSDIKDAITFYQPDGTEEGELHAFADGATGSKEVPRVVEPEAVTIVEQKPETKENTIEVVLPKNDTEVKVAPEELPQEKKQVVVVEPIVVAPKTVSQGTDTTIIFGAKTSEPESLIVHEELTEKREPGHLSEIPDNLPLLPFESSPHVWSFSKYKDIFHAENPLKEEIQVITVMPKEKIDAQTTFQKQPEEKPTKKAEFVDEEVVLESIPYTKGDESLVFLAGVMLLVIILILGYMYSNGRL